MLYKVWAQNCVRPKGMRIVEATESDLQKVFDEIFDQACEENLIEPYILDEDGDFEQMDDWKVSAAYEQIKKWWDDCKTISSGDYMIVEAESRFDVEIPNACYGDTNMIFR